MTITEQPPPLKTEEDVLYCYNHPKVETRLRCNRCGQPICIKCARRTPVGFRCPQCLQNQQAIFYSATTVDYVLGAAVGLVLSGIAAYIMGYLGWFFAIFLGPIAGGIIAEAVFRVMGRRRGRGTGIMIVACIVLGALIAAFPLLFYILPILLQGSAQALGSMGLMLLGRFNIVYVVLASVAAYARLR